MKLISRSPEWLVVFAIAVFMVTIAALGMMDGGVIALGETIVYYRRLVGGMLARSIGLFALFWGIALMIRFAAWFVRAVRMQADLTAYLSRRRLVSALRLLAVHLGTLLFYSVLILAVLGLVTAAIGETHAFNSMRLKDETLMSVDRLLTGAYPPLALATPTYPGWFVRAVSISFTHLATAMVFVAFYMFSAHRQLFREMVAAFAVGLVLMFVVWLFVPALSPHDRYVDNVYDMPVSPIIAGAVAAYSPQEEIADFLVRMREGKAPLKHLPTSTMPSAHVAWATLVGYYLYRANRRVAVAVSLFLALSVFGTVLLAQHYFVDIPAGILVTLVSIAVVRAAVGPTAAGRTAER